MSSMEGLQEENTELTRRVAALEAALAQSHRERDDLRGALLQIPALVLLLRGKEHVIELANQPYLDSAGKKDVVGKRLIDAMPELANQVQLDQLDRVLTTGETFVGTRVPVDLDRTGTGELERRWYTLHYIARRGAGDEPFGVLVHAADVTEDSRTIAAQERAIRQSSTPLIPLAEGVVVMPLVGAIDSARAAQIMETLLQGVSAQQARIAILDITGVEIVDSHVANALLRTAQAANLLGTEVMLTGIAPDVARTLVDIGADMGTVKTRGTLQSAVAYALRRATPSLGR